LFGRLKAVQGTDHGLFFPACHQVNNRAFANIGQHQAHLPIEMHFINAHDFRGLKTVLKLQTSDKVADNLPDCAFRNPDLIGNAGECPDQSVAFDIADQPICCPVPVTCALRVLMSSQCGRKVMPQLRHLWRFRVSKIPTRRPCMGVSM
jgi:hypothetical protein